MTGVLVALGERLREGGRVDAVRLWWLRRALFRSVRGAEYRMRRGTNRNAMGVNGRKREV